MQHSSLMPIGSLVEPGTISEVIQVKNTVLSGIMVRTWDRMPAGPVTDDTEQAILSDVRLTADQARTLAANLLHAAQAEDGQQVSFFWHRASCDPLAQASGKCVCSGSHAAVAL